MTTESKRPEESTPAAPAPGSLEAFQQDAMTNNVDTTTEETLASEREFEADGADEAVTPVVTETPEVTPEPEAVAAEPTVEASSESGSAGISSTGRRTASGFRMALPSACR